MRGLLWLRSEESACHQRRVVYFVHEKQHLISGQLPPETLFYLYVNKTEVANFAIGGPCTTKAGPPAALRGPLGGTFEGASGGLVCCANHISPGHARSLAQALAGRDVSMCEPCCVVSSASRFYEEAFRPGEGDRCGQRGCRSGEARQVHEGTPSPGCWLPPSPSYYRCKEYDPIRRLEESHILCVDIRPSWFANQIVR